MKYFIVELRYLQPVEVVQRYTPDHREFLKSLYEKEILFFSGPAVPRTKGILIARAESEDELRKILSEDPYQKNSLVEPHFTEMMPVNFLPDAARWLGKDVA